MSWSVVKPLWESKSEALAEFPPQLVLLIQLQVQCISELDICLWMNNDKGSACSRICSNCNCKIR